jgi:hypothetical protein
MNVLDPLLFIAKYYAGDFSSQIYFEGEYNETKSANKLSWDPSSKMVIRHITTEGPKESNVQLRLQGDLVHYIPEAEKYSSADLKIVVRRLNALQAVFGGGNAGLITVRMEIDLYPLTLQLPPIQ